MLRLDLAANIAHSACKYALNVFLVQFFTLSTHSIYTTAIAESEFFTFIGPILVSLFQTAASYHFILISGSYRYLNPTSVSSEIQIFATVLGCGLRHGMNFARPCRK